jgi:hypothetical protein
MVQDPIVCGPAGGPFGEVKISGVERLAFATEDDGVPSSIVGGAIRFNVSSGDNSVRHEKGFLSRTG